MSEILFAMSEAEEDGDDIEFARLRVELAKLARVMPTIVVDSPPYDR